MEDLDAEICEKASCCAQSTHSHLEKGFRYKKGRRPSKGGLGDEAISCGRYVAIRRRGNYSQLDGGDGLATTLRARLPGRRCTQTP
jgi:hypothetical protein